MSVRNLILDGTNLEFRIFYVAQSYKNHNGANTLELMSRFLVTFKKLVERFDPTEVYASWDKKLAYPSTNFRKEILEGQYKAGRSKPDNVHELYDEEPKIIKLLSSLGVKHIFPNVLEADDVVAWLARTLPGDTIVVSGDHDLLQLVNEDTSVWDLKRLTTQDNFMEQIGIEPKYFKLYKAIMGDKSDNIPGLPGHGKVRSAKLAKDWEDATVTSEYREIVERNLKLVDLDYGFTIETGELDAYKMQFEKEKIVSRGDIDQFKQLCLEYGLDKEVEQIKDWKKVLTRNNLVSIINTLFS